MLEEAGKSKPGEGDAGDLAGPMMDLVATIQSNMGQFSLALSEMADHVDQVNTTHHQTDQHAQQTFGGAHPQGGAHAH